MHKLTCGKRESVICQERSMNNRRAVGLLNSKVDKKGRQESGGEGTTPVTTGCPDVGK